MIIALRITSMLLIGAGTYLVLSGAGVAASFAIGIGIGLLISAAQRSAGPKDQSKAGRNRGSAARAGTHDSSAKGHDA
jgi:multisubunit Na+/H+ antiporter MnhC subunit